MVAINSISKYRREIQPGPKDTTASPFLLVPIQEKHCSFPFLCAYSSIKHFIILITTVGPVTNPRW